jgi:hypothetical protein
LLQQHSFHCHFDSLRGVAAALLPPALVAKTVKLLHTLEADKACHWSEVTVRDILPEYPQSDRDMSVCTKYGIIHYAAFGWSFWY